MSQSMKSTAAVKCRYSSLLLMLLTVLLFASCSVPDEEIGKMQTDPKELQAQREDMQISGTSLAQVPVYPGCEGLASDKERKQCMDEKIREFIDEEFRRQLEEEGIRILTELPQWISDRAIKDINLQQ